MPEKLQAGARRLSRRTLWSALFVLVAIPVTILAGVYALDDRKYYFVSLLILLYTMLPFAMVFERRKPQARELVVIAVMTALAVAGRGAFYMLPQFKPVLAIVIIAGVGLGAEAGFLVGAMAGFVSNFFFGQGPWTPWQMFGFGLVGFLAGLLAKSGLLKQRRLPIVVYGGLAALLVYGSIVNLGTLLMGGGIFTWPALVALYASGFWFDLVHAAATVFFLFLVARPMLEKLERVKSKYGLMEP